MFEDLWTEFWAIPANELFWCSLVAGAAFAADFTVRYILFPKVGMDRRWAYAFGVSSGLLAFGIMCEEGAVWMGVGSLFIFVPGIWIYDNRFDRSKQYRK